MTRVVIDQALPALGVLTDRAALGALLERTGWLDQPRLAEADVRLRWKPGTNVRAGVVVPTARGPAALLLAGFPPATGARRTGWWTGRTASAHLRCATGPSAC